MFANANKCCFAQSNLKYLGHIISHQGVAANVDKIKVMLNWPIPCSLKELRGFLGLIGYDRCFVAQYGNIAWPLTELLKKDNFNWNPEAKAAFQTLKTTMSQLPVLALPDFSKPFIIETNASGIGIKAVLLQENHPLAFFSQAFLPSARLKSVYERELMAIVRAIQKWRHYLLDRKFIVRTDQRNLKFLLDQRMVSLEYQKWLCKLLGYDFDIEYKPEKTNCVANALSRISAQPSLQSLSIPRAL